MHSPRAFGLLVTLMLLRPAAGWADDVDVPELGVKLTGLPSGAVKPQVMPRAGGHELTTSVGNAVLTVYREDAAAPPGSSVASPVYRASLDGRFQPIIDSQTEGAPTAINGHSAWTVVDARRGSRAQTEYLCVTYVIVDQHLYRIAVSASSASTARPAEFDALVRTMSDMTFEPLPRETTPVTPG
jgi:hypothetical protein